jgi:hypothetical protein
MENLITLEEFKTAKNRSKTDTDDQLEWLITAASSIIQTYLKREFSDTGNNITEVFNLDYDATILYLDKYPITELVSVEEINPYGYDSTVHFPVPETDYYIDAVQGRLIRLSSRYWPQGPGAVIVTYKAGFNGGVAAVPADLKQATIDLVAYYEKEEYKPSMQTRGATLTNAVPGARGVNDFSPNFPPHIQRILDFYK